MNDAAAPMLTMLCACGARLVGPRAMLDARRSVAWPWQVWAQPKEREVYTNERALWIRAHRGCKGAPRI